MAGRDADKSREFSWLRSIASSIAIVVALVVIFAYVPDRLADFIDEREVSSDVRDLALVAWYVAAVGLVSWGLARLQHGRVI